MRGKQSSLAAAYNHHAHRAALGSLLGLAAAAGTVTAAAATARTTQSQSTGRRVVAEVTAEHGLVSARRRGVQ